MELFVKIVNRWKPLTIFRKKFYLRCLTGFLIHVCVCWFRKREVFGSWRHLVQVCPDRIFNDDSAWNYSPFAWRPPGLRFPHLEVKYLTWHSPTTWIWYWSPSHARTHAHAHTHTHIHSYRFCYHKNVGMQNFMYFYFYIYPFLV